MITTLLAVLAAEAVVATAPPTLVEPDPKTMTRSEIRAFNATVTRDHPYYIRCVRASETGSLVKTTYSCRTNAQWNKSQSDANDEARAIYDDMKSKSWSTSG